MKQAVVSSRVESSSNEDPDDAEVVMIDWTDGLPPDVYSLIFRAATISATGVAAAVCSKLTSFASACIGGPLSIASAARLLASAGHSTGCDSDVPSIKIGWGVNFDMA